MTFSCFFAGERLHSATLHVLHVLRPRLHAAVRRRRRPFAWPWPRTTFTSGCWRSALYVTLSCLDAPPRRCSSALHCADMPLHASAGVCVLSARYSRSSLWSRDSLELFVLDGRRDGSLPQPRLELPRLLHSAALRGLHVLRPRLHAALRRRRRPFPWPWLRATFTSGCCRSALYVTLSCLDAPPRRCSSALHCADVRLYVSAHPVACAPLIFLNVVLCSCRRLFLLN